jgi:hypothetical protein
MRWLKTQFFFKAVERGLDLDVDQMTWPFGLRSRRTVLTPPPRQTPSGVPLFSHFQNQA